MTDRPLLFPNIAAEEGPDWRRQLAQPAVVATLSLWSALFRPGAAWSDADVGELPAAVWPPGLDAAGDAAVFDGLEGDDLAFAWLNTDEAARAAARAGRRLAGASPDCVARVHDKAFADTAAREADAMPESLAALVTPVAAEVLTRTDEALDVLSKHLARWPDWAKEHFTLKPRLGCSGRGRVAGRDGRVDTPELRGALPRLAQCGGAMLEPWLARTSDLSTALSVREDGSVVLLGTLEQVMAPSGVPLGHRGFVDARGRVHAGTEHDEALRAPAAAIAVAAAQRGYHGPCGVDAFAFHGPGGGVELRPGVELNARFTLGAVVVGLVKRAVPGLKKQLGIAAEQRRAFYFGLDAPAGGWPDPDDRKGLALVRLASPEAVAQPALLVAEDAAALDAVLPGTRP